MWNHTGWSFNLDSSGLGAIPDDTEYQSYHLRRSIFDDRRGCVYDINRKFRVLYSGK